MTVNLLPTFESHSRSSGAGRQDRSKERDGVPSQNDNNRADRPASSPTAAFLRSKDAAQYLRDHYGFGSNSALEKFRMLGDGPNYYKPNGRTVLYSPGDLEAWATSLLASHHVMPATSSMK